MPSYLLPCSCGESVVVETHQAGGRVTCACGANLEVPPLSRLRDFEIAPDTADTGTGSGWSFRQGVATVALLASVALAGVGGYFWSLEPPPPKAFEAADWEARSAEVIAAWSPQDCLKYWWLHYRELATAPLQAMPTDNPRLIKTAEFYRLGRYTVWGLAAVAGVAGLAVACGGQRTGEAG